MKENIRKCIKCGASRADDPDITLHRFPIPRALNAERCEQWAKFAFPHRNWRSREFQEALYKHHRMLCNKHFSRRSYINKKLVKNAIPQEDVEAQNPNMNINRPPDQILTERNLNIDLPGPSRAPPHQMELVDEPGPSKMIYMSQNLNVETPRGQDNKKIHILKKKERYLYFKCQKEMKKVQKLQNQTKYLKKEAFLNTLIKDESVNKLLETKMSSSFALLLQGQIKNYKRVSKGRRWNTEAKIIALRLYKRSPTCYRLLRRLICLPAPSTLKNLLQNLKLDVGPNKQIFAILKKTLREQAPADKEYILMFDEMSIKKNLMYNRKTDMIEGYQDHADHGRTSEFASYALVFMIAGIRKKLKQPVAYYLSGGSLKGDRLAVLIKQVLRDCFDAGLNITGTVCDMDGANKRALAILGATAEKPSIVVDGHEIVTLFDTPHLLKCFRNNFLKYDIRCPTDIMSNEKQGMGVAKWKHIKQFYELDSANPNFVFAPSLKKDHLQPNGKQKMKVKLAAQVLSHTVAAGIYAKIAQGELPGEAATTANVLSNMDKLFDSVNASTSDLRRGKEYSTNLKKNSPHLEHFKKMRQFFKNMSFLESKRPPPSLEGWIWTLNGIEKIWATISTKHPTVKSLSTRRLQQDPLENLFGCIRGHCGSNTNPTVSQFIAGLKTAILSNLSQGTIGC